MVFLAIYASLFSVLNPLGSVPVFLALTPDETKAQRNKVARTTSMYVVAILVAFFLAGTYILQFFGISLDAMRIAGGIVIFTSGYGLLQGKFQQSRAFDSKVKEAAMAKEDISFTPMAMPLLAGPGSISLLISLYAENSGLSNLAMIIGVIISLGLTIYFVLKLSPWLSKLLGVGGMRAISRIMGFIVMAIGVQYVTVGIVSQVQQMIA